jgi:hypothetical protein
MSIRIEFYDTETRLFNSEEWTAPITTTAEMEFCEYLRANYVFFSDSQGEVLEGGVRFSPQFDTWCSARVEHTRNWYGWSTFQEALNRYPVRGSTIPPRPTRTGRIHFNPPPARNDWAALYGNRPVTGILDESFHGAGFTDIKKHHHFCDKCQKTSKCGLCDGKPKVRKLCESCEMAETIRSIQGVTMSTPNIPASQYRVTLHNTTGTWDGGWEWTRLCAWCQQQLWKSTTRQT